MDVFTITALVLAVVLVPVAAGAIIVIRQDTNRERRDDRWLSRQR